MHNLNLALVLIVAAALAGCGKRVTSNEPVAPGTAEPDKFGVVCYSRAHSYGVALSCVKVRD